ncbi:MAG: hypothetical protein HC802_18395 [Caldilineaceae bacterium]|nr:hypothetical protein [Caldilineaceae bacterium]
MIRVRETDGDQTEPMAKILLCHPLFLSQSPNEAASSSPYFPLGLLYLAAYVRERGHQVAVFDGTFEADESAFEKALAAESADMVGISVLQTTVETAMRLAEMAKSAGVYVMVGGPEPTRDPRAFLRYEQVDVVVHHEGEQTLAALLDLCDAGKLIDASLAAEWGIAYRDREGNPVVNQPRPPIQNLDELPLPARDLIDMDKYLETWTELNGYSSMTISMSRGCPYGCQWCRDAVHGNDFRQRSPANVAAEMKMLKESYRFDRLRVVDDVDGLSREWIDSWAAAADEADALLPFEALNDLKRQDLPMLDVRDSL